MAKLLARATGGYSLADRGQRARSSSPPATADEEELLLDGRRGMTPGKRFKAKAGGRWQDYAPHCNQLLQEAYAAGCPSMRLNVQGHMYKFDFEKMEQKNLSTLETSEMRAPHDAARPEQPSVSSLLTMENLWSPLTEGKDSLKSTLQPQRPIFVVRVPKGGPGSTIRVPHCKKLGKAMEVAVPAEAKVGQPLFLPVPRTGVATKFKYAAAGAASGAGTAGATVAAVAGADAAGAAAAGGAGLLAAEAAAVAAPLIIGGVAVAGVAVAAGIGVHYATKSPGKAVAVGALTIAGLALAAHVAEVGVVEAAGDVAEGAGDLVDGVGEAAEGAVDVGEELLEDLLDAVEWLGDVGEDGVDIILDLF